jgi:hypothetical protein
MPAAQLQTDPAAAQEEDPRRVVERLRASIAELRAQTVTVKGKNRCKLIAKEVERLAEEVSMSTTSC